MVEFYKLDEVQDNLIVFCAMVVFYKDKLIMCMHKDRRGIYELPGGHREEKETVIETAKRELWEETGAIDFSLTPYSIYRIVDKHVLEKETEYKEDMYGMLLTGEVFDFEALPAMSEMKEVLFFEKLPEASFLRYPQVYLRLFRKAGLADWI